MGRRPSSFSVLLLAVFLSVVGIASLPMLNICYKPSSTNRSISVSFSYPGASAEIVESEVTSKIEGAMARLPGNTGTSSTSAEGVGNATVTFGKNTDISSARLELASAIRMLYPGFPEGVSYPSISLGTGGQEAMTVLTYSVKGDIPSRELEKFAGDRIVPEISSIRGVDKVSIYGASPYQWTINFDARTASSLGISPLDIASAFRESYSEAMIGMCRDSDESLAVRFSCAHDSGDFGDIPVKNVNGQTVFLRDIADWSFEESQPSSYYRVNGLNTITMVVSMAQGANLLKLASSVRRAMLEMQDNFPDTVSAGISYDASEFVSDELHRIFRRTALCVLILLLLVLLATGSWRYMLITVLTLAVNILISLGIYAFAGLEIHIYTLAGITVSLGLVIDSSIVVIDHYARFRNGKVFPALFAAVSTTVVALLLVLLLPDSEKANLKDFVLVIVLNLAVSLAVSLFFVPALMDYLPVKGPSRKMRFRCLRRRSVWFSRYGRYLEWSLRHRWIHILIPVLAFGLPLCLLPTAAQMQRKTERNVFQNIVTDVVSWRPYAEHREVIDKVAGTSFAAFHRAAKRSSFYREPQQNILYIKAGMLEGCTVHQLNEVMKAMENYLAGFEGIKSFVTRVTSYSRGSIEVFFKPEYEKTAFPIQLKAQVMSKAADLGGANWSVSGLDDSWFNNNIVSNVRSHRITLRGYNYKDLYEYAEKLKEYLASNRRVSAVEVRGARSDAPHTEFNMDYDFERMAIAGVTPIGYHSALSAMLYQGRIASIRADGGMADIVLRSSEVESYDYWNVLNAPVDIPESAFGGTSVPLNGIGSIVKQSSAISISKSDQSYELNVCFDFLGSYEIARRTVDAAVTHMNDEVLPPGFRAFNPYVGMWDNAGEKYAWLILLIVAALFVMLSIAFESLKLPFAVIFMVPVSFIGLFLTFGLSNLSFDQGGFAAFVMLCGIVVNAGIYLVFSYKDVLGTRRFSRNPSDNHDLQIQAYLKAFSYKLGPIMLTVASTVLGLVPFLTDGPQEVFWFDFAVGTISGMLFSLIALVLILPVLLLYRR